MKTFKIRLGLLLSVVLFTLNSCVEEPFQPVVSTLVIHAPKSTVQLTYYSNDGKGGIAQMSEIVDLTDYQYYRFNAEVGKTQDILEKHPEYFFIKVQRVSGNSPIAVTPIWMVTINDHQERLLINTDYSIQQKFDALCTQTDFVTIWNDNEVHSISSVMYFPPPTIEL